MFFTEHLFVLTLGDVIAKKPDSISYSLKFLLTFNSHFLHMKSDQEIIYISWQNIMCYLYLLAFWSSNSRMVRFYPLCIVGSMAVSSNSTLDFILKQCLSVTSSPGFFFIRRQLKLTFKKCLILRFFSVCSPEFLWQTKGIQLFLGKGFWKIFCINFVNKICPIFLRSKDLGSTLSGYLKCLIIIILTPLDLNIF